MKLNHIMKELTVKWIVAGIDSRGINNIARIAKRVGLNRLLSRRWGATPDGLTKVLAFYGITEETLGIKITQ